MTGERGFHGRGKVLAAALVSGLAALALAVTQPRDFFPAYLAAAVAWNAVPIGCLPILMIGALVPGRWIDVLRPALQAGAATIPVAGLLFLPVLVGLGSIYPWTGEGGSGAAGSFRAAWLSPGFFVARTILYFGVFAALAFAFARPAATPRPGLAAFGLVAYTLLGSWAGIDWMISIEPRYHSSIFGLITLSQHLLGGLSFGLIVALTGPGAPAKTGGLGALLLSAILLWAYLHAMQFIIAWMASIPVEADWYLRRGAGIWGVSLWVLGSAQFLGPFLLLLLEPVRRSRGWLVALALLTIGLRPLETAWLTLPARDLHGLWPGLATLVSAVAIGCVLAEAFLFATRRNARPAPA